MAITVSPVSASAATVPSAPRLNVDKPLPRTPIDASPVSLPRTTVLPLKELATSERDSGVDVGVEWETGTQLT